jgi:signal transduction histidine kinase
MNLSHTPSRSRQKRPAHLPENNLTASSFIVTQKSMGVLDGFPRIVERMHVEQVLLASQRRIQELEKDRERIKCDLHDGVLQSLYAVGLGLESCGLLLQDAPSKVTKQLKHSAAQLDQALRELRSFLRHDLGHEGDGREDFGQALRAQVEAMTGISSMQCRLTIDHAAIVAIPRERRKDILHFAREALSNCVRHARATRVEVSLTLKNGIPRLGICDDGIGFTPHNPPKLGLGLHSLAARAAALGGRVDIVSAPAQGTKITLELPRT